MNRFKNFVKKHLVVFHSVALSSIMLAGYFFGSGVLSNAHLTFIRYKAKDVVTLLNSRGGGGTGFVVKGKSSKLYILTNNHICKSANGLPLMAIYRGDKFIVNPVKVYKTHDLCAVESPLVVSDYFKIAGNVKFGEKVYSIGHPLLEPITVTEGELSSIVKVKISEETNVTPEQCRGDGYEIIDLSDDLGALLAGIRNVCLRTLMANSSTVTILPGNSGSPTVNIFGNVVAVVFAANESGTHSYHVPLSDVKAFLDTL